jgi:hypothetical protein
MLVAENGECREKRWYNYKRVPFLSHKSGKEAAEELLELYRGAVRRLLTMFRSESLSGGPTQVFFST